MMLHQICLSVFSDEVAIPIPHPRLLDPAALAHPIHRHIAAIPIVKKLGLHLGRVHHDAARIAKVVADVWRMLHTLKLPSLLIGTHSVVPRMVYPAVHGGVSSRP